MCQRILLLLILAAEKDIRSRADRIKVGMSTRQGAFVSHRKGVSMYNLAYRNRQ